MSEGLPKLPGFHFTDVAVSIVFTKDIIANKK